MEASIILATTSVLELTSGGRSYGTGRRGIGEGVGVLFSHRRGSFRQPLHFAVLADGYTAFIGNRAANAAHFGGGVDHWDTERWALRFEARDYFLIPEAHNILEFRLAVLFQ